MPMFDVIGADRATGQPRKQMVEADDEQHAYRVIGRSMLVEKVRRIEDEIPVARAVSAPPTAWSRVSNYPAIVSGAAVLGVIGVVAMVLGAFACVAGLYFVGQNEVDRAITAIVAGLGLLFYGVMIRFVGAMGEAVRDIARATTHVANHQKAWILVMLAAWCLAAGATEKKTPLPPAAKSSDPAAIADSLKKLAPALMGRIDAAELADAPQNSNSKQECTLEGIDVKKTDSLLRPTVGVIQIRRKWESFGVKGDDLLTVTLAPVEGRWECLNAILESKEPGQAASKHDWTRYLKKIMSD